MQDRSFFTTRVGQAAFASVLAMAAFVVMSTQVAIATPLLQVATTNSAELA